MRKIALIVLVALLSGCSLYTKQSPLPNASVMIADCQKTPGSVSCDVYNILNNICTGKTPLPITLGNYQMDVCDNLGYGATPSTVPSK